MLIFFMRTVGIPVHLLLSRAGDPVADCCGIGKGAGNVVGRETSDDQNPA